MTTPFDPSVDLCVDREYAETYAFLSSLERFGMLFGLENISVLLDQLGNPHKTFPVVHIGGSNGKGSTASFTCGVLREAGFKTALYTSPHLNDFRERVRLNGAMVSKEDVTASTNKIRGVYNPERTTFFEFTTAVAFDCLAKAKPDIAVIEVGLGGRLDATNVVEPLVTVITDISREHEDYLGTGLAAIAREKAGIIKRGVPLITGASRSEARGVITGVARDMKAPIREFGRNFRGIRTGPDRFTYKSENVVLEDLSLGMAGAYQVKNASLAVALIEECRAKGYSITDDAIRKGLQGAKFAGRFELLARRPDVIIDGAHSPESMRLLKSNFRQRYPGVRPLLLLGMLGEKKHQEMVGIIAPMAREVVCVTPQGDRALDANALVDEIRSIGVSASSADSIGEGFRQLREKASDNDVILATGSLYMIGPVRTACGVADD